MKHLKVHLDFHPFLIHQGHLFHLKTLVCRKCVWRLSRFGILNSYCQHLTHLLFYMHVRMMSVYTISSIWLRKTIYFVILTLFVELLLWFRILTYHNLRTIHGAFHLRDIGCKKVHAIPISLLFTLNCVLKAGSHLITH